MLVLSRKPGESIDIDGPAKITVLEFRRDKIRVGIEAAPGVRILRSELPKRNEPQNELRGGLETESGNRA